MYLHSASEKRNDKLTLPSTDLCINVSPCFRTWIAAIAQKINWSIGNRRSELIRKKPRIRSNVLTIDVQALSHPHVREIHVLKSHFQLSIQILGSKRNRPLPLPVFPLPPQRHIDHDTVINHVLTAAHKRRPAAEYNKIAFLLPLDYC